MTNATIFGEGNTGARDRPRVERWWSLRRPHRQPPAGVVNAIDAGALRRARELEAFGFLQLTLAGTGRTSWTGGFAVVL